MKFNWFGGRGKWKAGENGLFLHIHAFVSSTVLLTNSAFATQAFHSLYKTGQYIFLKIGGLVYPEDIVYFEEVFGKRVE